MGVLAKIPAENVGIQTQLAKECLRHSAFVKVPASRPHRQSQHGIADGIEKRRTRKKQIFDCRCLKNAIVGSMDQQVDCRHESRHADSRTPRRLMNYKSIVLESQASADVPPPKSYLVLYVNGRLDIPFSVVRKRKIQLCPGIELRCIGNGAL